MGGRAAQHDAKRAFSEKRKMQAVFLYALALLLLLGGGGVNGLCSCKSVGIICRNLATNESLGRMVEHCRYKKVPIYWAIPNRCVNKHASREIHCSMEPECLCGNTSDTSRTHTHTHLKCRRHAKGVKAKDPRKTREDD